MVLGAHLSSGLQILEKIRAFLISDWICQYCLGVHVIEKCITSFRHPLVFRVKVLNRIDWPFDTGSQWTPWSWTVDLMISWFLPLFRFILLRFMLLVMLFDLLLASIFLLKISADVCWKMIVSFWALQWLVHGLQINSCKQLWPRVRPNLECCRQNVWWRNAIDICSWKPVNDVERQILIDEPVDFSCKSTCQKWTPTVCILIALFASEQWL